jgi:uncharacterized membrane protein YdbT with pleckstrin-like domain
MAADPGTSAVNPDLVSAMVPAQMLDEDEVVLILTKPSLFYIFYTSAFFIAITLVIGALAAKTAYINDLLNLTPRSIAFITLLVCLGRIIWALLVWTSHVYMLTNRRVVTIKGVINVHVFQAPLRKIQSTLLYRPIFQRLIGTGTIGFSTAAAAGSPESTWVMISRPEETLAQITNTMNKSK